MATATAYNDDYNTHDNNLETFALLWLDTAVNTSKNNREAQQQLRSIINHIITFENANLCRQYIRSICPEDRLVLIVSGRLGQEIVPHIHRIRQLSSIYVYCIDKTRNEKWTKNFVKVKAVTDKLDDLVFRIKADHKKRMKVQDQMVINIMVSNNPDRSTTRLNGHSVHSLLLIDVLLRMQPVKTDKQELITLCKKQYEGNKNQLDILRKFEKEYSPENALWWYTCESFLYRMLNKALRIQNIDLLFLFRFFIRDIHRELERNQCKIPMHVFRGQLLSNDELENLRKSIDEFISISSFFSTTISRYKALEFMNHSDISDDLQRVLFEIDADPRKVTTKPFAQINSHSEFADELEVLFMIGSIFRLKSVYKNNDQIWIIRLKLCDDDDKHDLKTLFEHMKNTYGGDHTTTLLTFGEVLRQMGKYNLAEKFYRRLLNELPRNDPLLSNLYYALGLVLKDREDLDSSLQCLRKSIEIKVRASPHDYRSISDCYNAMRTVHRMKGHYDIALSWFNKGIELLKQKNAADDSTMAYFYNNMAIVYEQQMKYDAALDFNTKALTIREQNLPPNHPDIGLSHNNLGNIYYCLGYYHLALEHYNQSLNIRLNSLPPDHPHITQSYRNLGLAHENIGKLKEASVFYQDAATIRRQTLFPQHPDIVEIEEDIKRVSSKPK